MRTPLQNGEQRRADGPWLQLGSVLFSPQSTFESLAQRPYVFPGYALQTAVSLVVTAVSLPAVYAAATQQMNSVGISQDAATISLRAGLAASAFGVFVSPWLVGFFIAVTAMFFGQFLGGAPNLRTYMALVGYARVPLALNTLLLGFLILVKGINAQATVSLSVAVFLPDGANPYLRTVLSSIGPFDLWYLYLLGLGFSTLHGEKPRQGLLLSGVVYGLGLLFALAGMALTKSLIVS
jgi:hypothetical protein